jgi:hypothetical protein
MKRSLRCESLPAKKSKREPSARGVLFPPEERHEERQPVAEAQRAAWEYFEDPSCDQFYDLPVLEDPDIDMHPDKLCGSERCDLCFKKSIASNRRVASFLAANPSANAFEVLQLAHDMYQWQCFECDHTFTETCFSVTLGIWCPKCADRMYA